MDNSAYIHKLAERIGLADSPAMHRILQCAVTDDEARFLLDLPASAGELAARYATDERGIETRILDLARRGLVVKSRKGMQFPYDPATLHDSMLSSAQELIPPGVERLWMELYDGEGWGVQIGTVLSGMPERVLRTIPIEEAVAGTTLLPHESVAEIIRAHQDLISVRNCCCRVGAKKCDHPTQVCMQFAGRAEYDIERGSGRKVLAQEALAIAAAAGQSGLVPTVSNVSQVDMLDFICFCCGCCCLVINPGLRVGAVDKILAPSRFVSNVDAEVCNGCGECAERCAVKAISVQDDQGSAVVEREKCLGCGACVLACPLDGGMTMQIVRPPAFIPETNFATSILHL